MIGLTKRFCFLLLLGSLSGCKARDGDLLGLIFQRTGRKIQAVAGGSSEVISVRLQRNLAQVGMAERVANRLRWDRHLDQVSVEVKTMDEGAIRIEGVVANPETKQRLLDLARTTTGVERLEDAVTIAAEK